MARGKICFQAQAYCKIIMHAAKYPHCSVNGVLLSKSNSTFNDIEYVDAIPLFHMSLNLTPMAEIALMQIDEMASKRDLIISGYYVISERPSIKNFDQIPNRIPERIAANFPHSCFVVVDNVGLGLDMTNHALNVAQYSDGSYKSIDSGATNILLEPENTLEICSQLMDENVYDFLIDFDLHLDDLREDWLNPKINQLIDSLVVIND